MSNKFQMILKNLILLHSTSGKGYNVCFLDKKKIQQIIPPQHFPKKFKNLQHVIKTENFVSTYILHKYGGIWIDSNTIVMKNLDELFDIVYG